MSISLLQDHPRFKQAQVASMLAKRDPETPAPTAQAEEDLQWFLNEVIRPITMGKDLLAMVSTSITKIQPADVVTSKGGMTLGPLPDRLDVEATQLTVSRSHLSTMLHYLQTCKPEHAIRMARFGLEEAMKDNLLKAADISDRATVEENLAPLSGATLMCMLEDMRPTTAEVCNFAQQR